MADEKNIYLFEKEKISKAVISMAVPTIISSLVMVIYNLADTYFVGMLDNAVENAAVTLAAPVLLAFNAINNLFGIGCSSLMSRSLGAKEYEKVKDVSAFGFYITIICSLLFSILSVAGKTPLLNMLGTDSETINATSQYLKWTVSFGAVPAILNVVLAYFVRSEGNTLHASIGTMSGCLLNIVLDPLFILPSGLGMGAAGAGAATFISNCAACIYFFVWLFIHRRVTCISLTPKRFISGKNNIMEIFGVGIPASIQNLLNVTGMTILNNFTSSFGADAVAAMGIAQKVNMVPMYVALGFSQGVMPLISYNYASKNYKRMKKGIILSGEYSVGILLIMVAVYFFGADFWINLFIDNQVIVNYGSAFLKGMCFALPFLCIDFLAVGVFQAVGMGKKALFFAILRKIIMEIPAIIILNKLWPLYGMAYAQTVTEIVLAITAVLVLKSMFKKMKNAT